MAAHLTAPLAAGAVEAPLTPDAAGRIRVDFATREPLVLVAPARSLENETWRVLVTINPGAANAEAVTLVFAPFTEAGAYLPAYRPPVNPATQRAGNFTLQLSATPIVGGVEARVPAGQVAGLLRVRLLEGVLGRLLYILGAEKARIRRTGREIVAMRQLEHAHGDALDRLGAELGVVRFTDRIDVKVDPADVTPPQIVTVPYAAGEAEPDDDYRDRLAIYRGLNRPTLPAVNDRLNGPGEPGDPNAGLLARVGVAERVALVEADNEFAVAIHIAGAGDAVGRDNFFEYLRQVYLVFPAATPAADAIHAARMATTDQQQRMTGLRQTLRDTFKLAAPALALAPMLAGTLGRVGQLLAAVGLGQALTLRRGQDPAAGSRYQLGLGADVDFGNTFFADLEQRVAAFQQQAADGDAGTLQTVADLNAAGGLGDLLLKLTPLPLEQDRTAAWFFGSLGLRTVHPLTATRLYVSHLPTFGLVIEGPDIAPVGQPATYSALHHAPRDPGPNVVISEGLAAALAAWRAAGNTGWTALADAEAQALFDAPAEIVHLGTGGSLGAGAAKTLAAARLHLFRDAADMEAAMARLKQLPSELHKTLRLPNSLANPLRAGNLDAVAPLMELTRLLRDNGLAAVLPLVTNNAAFLVVSVVALPGADVNLADRRSAGFRWYVVPIGQRAGSLGPIGAVGSRTTWTPASPGGSPGPAAIIALGYARRGLTDPYEYRVELPDAARLTIRQYEYLMNVLQHSFPIGVEINTFSIRQDHVDLDGDGLADALPPALFRSFRQFRRRERGEAAAILMTGDG
jgi:hypothetical protein